MSKIVPSPFCGIQFQSDEELLRAQVLLTNQKDWIQYNLSIFAMERLALAFDPANPSVFLQQEAELKGKIGILQYLLDCSTAAEISLKPAPADSGNQNSQG